MIFFLFKWVCFQPIKGSWPHNCIIGWDDQLGVERETKKSLIDETRKRVRADLEGCEKLS